MFNIGPTELFIILVVGLYGLIPIAGLAILVLVYFKVNQIEKKLDNLK